VADNTIDDLREHLFETLRALRDKDNPMDIERARAISEVAQVVINTAKVEVDYLRVNGAGESNFLGSATEKLPAGVKSITQHRLKG
jgi:hypothetical protein